MKAMPFIQLLVCSYVLGLQASCATIVKGTRERVLINSNPQGATLVHNNNVLGKTPFSLEIDKKDRLKFDANNDLVLEMDGYEPYYLGIPFTFDMGWSFWGNMGLGMISAGIGGIVGYIVDWKNGMFYNVATDKIEATLRPVGTSLLPVSRPIRLSDQERLTGVARQRMAAQPMQSTPVSDPASNIESTTEKLKALNKMKEDGLINEDEYNNKRKEIIDKM
jgi:hypothetical protein